MGLPHIVNKTNLKNSQPNSLVRTQGKLPDRNSVLSTGVNKVSDILNFSIHNRPFGFLGLFERKANKCIGSLEKPAAWLEIEHAIVTLPPSFFEV